MADTSATLLLRTEPIGKLLLRYSLPAIAAMVVFSLYNIIDSIFIGHGVGPLAISGLVSIDWSNTKYGNPFCVAAQDGKMWHSTEGGVEEKAKKVRWACFEASRLQNQAEKYTSGTAPKDGFG